MIKIIQYNDALLFKPKNKRIVVIRDKDDNGDEFVIIYFTKLLILETQEEKDEYININNKHGREFIYRSYSKYCIWHNQINLSMEGFSCLHEAFEIMNKIDTYVWKEKEKNNDHKN